MSAQQCQPVLHPVQFVMIFRTSPLYYHTVLITKQYEPALHLVKFPAISKCSRSHIVAADFSEPLFIQHEQNGCSLFQGISRRLAELPRTCHRPYHTSPLGPRLRDTTHGRWEPLLHFFHAWSFNLWLETEMCMKKLPTKSRMLYSIHLGWNATWTWS